MYLTLWYFVLCNIVIKFQFTQLLKRPTQDPLLDRDPAVWETLVLNRNVISQCQDKACRETWLRAVETIFSKLLKLDMRMGIFTVLAVFTVLRPRCDQVSRWLESVETFLTFCKEPCQTCQDCWGLLRQSQIRVSADTKTEMWPKLNNG